MTREITELTLFHDIYRPQICLKSGRMSWTYRCTHRNKCHKCVVKAIDYSKLSFEDHLSVAKVLRDECHRYEEVMHRHIAQTYESYILSHQILLIVYEFIEGNNLLEEIVKRVGSGYVYSENVISYYMNQIMEAIEYCHKSDIIHGNIKAENILMATNNSTAPVKLCGFGRTIAQTYLLQSPVHHYERNNLFNTLSNPYLAPELTQERGLFTKYSDIYSCGILLLTLLCGSVLNFDPQIDFFSIEEKIWNNISDIAKELVLKMLKPNASSRITAEEALNHKWLSEKELFARKTHLMNTIEEMRRYNNITTLKKNICLVCFPEKFDENVNLKHNETEYPLLVGVIQVIESLDKILSLSSLNSRQDFVLDLILNDKKFNKFLKLFDFTSKCVKNLKQSIPDCSAYELREEVLHILETLPLLATSDTIVSELINILYSPYIQTLVRTQDFVSEMIATNCESEVSTPENNSCQSETSHSSHGSDDNITSVRLVQFQKHSNEPMGITLKMDDWGRCVVSRIMHGGLIHRQGTLHVGDVIQEINEIPVSNQSVESLQTLMRDSKGNVFTFKIIANNSQRLLPSQCQIHFRAHFDYDPKDDDLIPSIEAGLAFSTGDILEVICKDDYYWWQSRKEGNKGSAGLIPSPELIEWRTFHKSKEKIKKDFHFFSKKKKREKYLAKRDSLSDVIDIQSYEEIVYLSSFQRKTLVLLGAHGIGRRHIKNTLISHCPQKYSYPIPHTTRFARRAEQNGKHYFFVSEQQMMEEIASNQYLEYGSHEEALYGTKLETIRQIITTDRIPILDVEPQALKMLRTGEFAPFVIFIAAPTVVNTEDSDGSLKRLTRESHLLHNSYKHLFDLSIINNDIEETVKLVDNSFNRINSSAQWVPCAWIY